MKLKSIYLENFRGYRGGLRISINENITTFVGRNDIGKSTILEALEIFFNNELIKISQEDLCVDADGESVTIGCEFTGFDQKVVIDSSKSTDLKEEYLLNQNNNLEIHAVFDCKKKIPKAEMYAYSYHPSINLGDDLLTLKINELKKRLDELGVEKNNIDLRSSSEIRKKIWSSFDDLELSMRLIQLNKEDAKKTWDSLSEYLPTFALFQSDRPSTDGDPEVQDPMKIAVKEALRQVEEDLNNIKGTVKEEATKVAYKTLEKLREMDSELANQLIPSFQAEPKWDSIFKLSLEGDNNIPINKRGSGVRRLILLNFFRAQAEKLQERKGTGNIIYAIEEPETSQHPSNQKLLIESLLRLSENDNCQVLLTTHVPELAGLMPIDSLRLLYIDDNNRNIMYGNEEVYRLIADELGILPDQRVQIFVCVEGPNDIKFLGHMSKILNKKNKLIPNLIDDYRITMLPLGGSTLKQWVHNQYLGKLGLPEVHIYDNDVEGYEKCCERVNKREDGSWAVQTTKKEMENYINPKVINSYFGISIDFNSNDNVPKLVWDALNQKKDIKKMNTRTIKRILNDEVASNMSSELLNEVDSNKEIETWLSRIARMLK